MPTTSQHLDSNATMANATTSHRAERHVDPWPRPAHGGADAPGGGGAIFPTQKNCFFRGSRVGVVQFHQKAPIFRRSGAISQETTNIPPGRGGEVRHFVD